MMTNYDVNRLEYIKQLEECEECVCINDPNELHECKNEIQQYEQNNQQYRIEIHFFSYPTSVESKMEVIDMIEQLNVNHKVGCIAITLHNDNKWNEEIMRRMIDNYQNVHDIQVYD